MTSRSRHALIAFVVACGLVSARAEAVVPARSTLADKVLRNPNLHIPTQLVPAGQLRDDLAARVQQDLAALGLSGDSAFYDARAGRLTSLVPSVPLVPGDGLGNALTWGGAGIPSGEALDERVWSAVRGYLVDHAASLRVDVAELGAARIGVYEQGNYIAVFAPRVLNGIAVRDSGVTAILNHGNLVLLGLENWGDARVEAVAILSETQAERIVLQHTLPFVVEGFPKSELQYVPMVEGDGYDYRLVWAIRADVQGDLGTWEGLVDAMDGEVVAFEDKNQYSRKVVGGVFPVSNDGRVPDGIEQSGWPMPFTNVVIGPNTTMANSSGLVSCAVAGNASTTLSGQFVRIVDNCGAINETSSGDFDLGTSAGTDCTIPAGHSGGDTHSARSGFYELNRMIENARGFLPGNAWLNAQLTANMNINLSCNAFWNGSTVNFYRDNGSQCRNTGEIAAVFDHEWGHGMDDNGVNGNISQPGEAIADIHGNMKLMNSCMGRGFFKNQTCGGYGDACIGTTATGCTGVRDLDFAQHRCNRPHTITWALSGFTSAQCNNTGSAPACGAGGGTPCGRETHCEGYIAAETGWDIFARDLQAAPFNFDANTALELATRLAFLGSQTLTSWYTCSVGGGCGATNGYMLWLSADDDNGNINDGTPHMSAIRAAFERHEIHCATPTVVDSGCAGGPTTAPVVTTTATTEGVDLSWAAVAGAASYNVYRTEGVAQCAFGKVKVANVTGTTFSETGLLAGRPYSYVVIPVGSNTSCFGRASACSTATPTAAAACPPLADFTLSCSPSSMTVLQGGTGNSTCTVQSLNAFASSVNLSCGGLPAGITCGYVPPAVTPPSNGSTTSALTVSVGAAVAPGTYNFQAQGVSGALTHTFGMMVTVTAIPDYTLTCSPSSLAVNQGGTGTSTCTVQSLNAFASAVTFSCTGLPAGVTCGYVPPTVTPPANGTATSILTVTVPTATPTGNYAFLASSVSGGLTRTFNMTLVVNSQSVAPFALSVDASGNGVFQPNETVTMAPTWRNTGTTVISLTGATSGFAGPAGAVYSNPDSSANYGTIGVSSNGSCVTNGNCYAVLATAATRPLIHWDATILETVNPTATTKTWTLHVGDSFTDVPATNGFYRFIETILHNNVTGGCSGTDYCPTASTTREQMAVFVLVAKSPTAPPPVACIAGSEMFTDVPSSSGFCRWIEELARRGVVSGCGTGLYCPSAPASREAMSVFVLRTLDPTLNPPACVPPNLFLDVPETSGFCRWIEELANRGIVTGCGGGNYCPTADVSREQMSVFLTVTFSLALYGL